LEYLRGEKVKVSAVIPAHNEASTVGRLVRYCKQYCSEVIVVDDGSVDGTCAISRASGAHVIRNNSNKGIVWSTEVGLRSASGDVIITLDADGQHDPSEIPVLVRPIAQGLADLVLGKREHGRPFSEHVISALTSLRVRCEDVGTGYRAFRRDLAHNIRLWGFCLCGSLVLEAQRRGARIVEVPITIRPRRAGESHWASPLSRGTVHFKQAILLASRLILEGENLPLES
jgi:glycosyltransferase involved in cell wall biosynthesis